MKCAKRLKKIKYPRESKLLKIIKDMQRDLEKALSIKLENNLDEHLDQVEVHSMLEIDDDN